ncbi:MlaD family protein [uncultured Jannaschia sp.]|uniref:MlaD family protein n=1 Tax=uncultured Jannaschia sp. TaxID=293347 RepID=UPI00261E44E9|nr:MlaD family protein [uncultured Jannaschia sp.]
MSKARPAVLGAFVFGAIGLAVAAVLFFGGARFFQPTGRAIIYFAGSVAGLDIGAPVTFRGVRVGTVQQIALHISAEGEARIPVIVEILPDQVVLRDSQQETTGTRLERLIAAGLSAQLASQSFVTGMLRVDLDFRPDAETEMVEVDDSGLTQIPAVRSGIERLLSALEQVPMQDVVQSAQSVLENVNRVTASLEGELGPLLDGARDLVETADRAVATTEGAVTQLQAELSSSLDEFDGLIGDARTQFAARGPELASLLASANGAAERAEALISSLEAIAAPRSRLRTDLEATASNLAASAASLRGFANAVERDPSTILRGR